MNVKFSKSLLLSGRDYRLTPSVTLHHPTIDEILSIDHSLSPWANYWSYVKTLLADPYSNMVMLDDLGINYMEVKPYEVFVLQWDICNNDYHKNPDTYETYQLNPLEIFSKAISFFLGEEHHFTKGVYENGKTCFYDIHDPSCQINEEIFNYLHEWIKSINHIDDSDKIKPADENARRVLIEDMRDEIKKQNRRGIKASEETDFIGNMMSAVIFCGNGSITPFNINDCKLYWLNESFSINNKKNHADHLLDGIYHGTVRSRDINKTELDWTK